MTEDRARNLGIVLRQVAWDDPRAALLRNALEREIQQRYRDKWSLPEEVALSDERERYRGVDPADVLAVVLLTIDEVPAAHGVLRAHGESEVEVKRVFVQPQFRGRGLARKLMAQLELLAIQRGIHRVVLQTGNLQPEAVALYRSLGYEQIPLFAPYAKTMPDSFCFAKSI